MRRPFRGVCVVMAVLFASPASALVIRDDHGGVVSDYLHHYLTSGPVEIVGLCESACTLALADPRTCVTPDARLGFHEASNPGGTRFMWLMMPERVQFWIATHGGLTPRIVEMSGREAINLGVRACR